MIWVIGGTSSSRDIINILKNKETDFFVTTAGKLGMQYLDTEKCRVIAGKLDENDMDRLLKKENVTLVIDASHPFAAQVSQNAVKTCGNNKVRYIRYERKTTIYEKALYYENFEEAAEALKMTDCNILLTIGVNNLNYFSRLDRKKVFVKVLAEKDSITKASDEGYTTENIIAMKGILSENMIDALIREYGIKKLITKDSGEEGGMNEKYRAAVNNNADFCIIKRPSIEYPEIYYEISEISGVING